VNQDQVVLAHSPLRMFKEFHNKRVLVSGQGPVREIASNLGFKDVWAIDDFSCFFPKLDVLDHNRQPRKVSTVHQFSSSGKYESINRSSIIDEVY
jgi:ribonucleotide monophosphatase NagD (HAD superfamily)